MAPQAAEGEARAARRGDTAAGARPVSRRDPELGTGYHDPDLGHGSASAGGNVQRAALDSRPRAPTQISYAVKLASLRGGVNVFDGDTGDNNLGVSITVQ